MNEKQPARDDYAELAKRLGFDDNAASIEGPVRGPHAGPSDEAPLEKLHRLSALMEAVASEIDGMRSTFGKTYAAEPDVLVEQLKEDAAIASADTLMLTIPSQLGVEFNLRVVESFAKHVAPSLGWKGTRG